MYTTSAAYRTAIMGNVLKYEWSGSLTTVNGDVYTFSPVNIDTMGSVTETASDSDRLTVGSVYASELNINFFSLVDSNLDTILAKDFDRYELYGAEIDLECTTCGETIPVGKYVIAETLRNVNMIEVKAYDFMTKFDKRYDSAADTSDLQPYAWLVSWCTACGVTLGSTEWDIAAMANNGLRSYKLAQVVDDLTTYRDALHYLSEILCAVCFIDRNGELVLKNYRRAVDLTIPTTWRWDCQIADYRTMYDGIFTTYVITQESEYTGTLSPVGLVYDFGVNPFLQITDGTARNIVKSNILNDLATITCTPFTATCPLDPSLDLMDVVELSGGVAEPGEYAVLTEITFYMDGTMDLSCSGANPKLQEVVSRVSKVADVAESQTYVNNSGVSIGSTDSYIIGNNLGNSVTITCTTDNQIVELLYTADFTLDEDSLVTCTLAMDGNTIQTYQELYFVGQHTMTVDHYYEISTSGDHTFTATVSAVYSPTPGGVSDYDNLTNKPEINSNPLVGGDQTGASLGLIDEPALDGTAGQVLTTDGAGGRSWADAVDSTARSQIQQIVPVETTSTASRSYAVGDYFVNENGVLTQATAAIALGGTIDSTNSTAVGQTLADVIEDRVYKPGDMVDLTGIICSGYLSGGRQDISFFLQFDRPCIATACTYDTTTTRAGIRHADGGYILANNTAISTLNLDSSSFQLRSTGVEITHRLHTASTFTNNSLINVRYYAGTLVFS